jgi:hypothetical protein
VQVALHGLGSREALENAALLGGVEGRTTAGRLETSLDPALLAISVMYMYSAPMEPQ